MAKTSKKSERVVTTTIEKVYSPKKRKSRDSKLIHKLKEKIHSKVKRATKRTAKDDEIRKASSRRSRSKSSIAPKSNPMENLWDKALTKNQKLEEWIQQYNEQMEKVDETELSIISE